MPSRIVDGDALWRSDKLNQVEPPSFRAEYANMIPLALADGSFECNPRRVWADVYSYNRSDISLEDVESILAEFERVGLLRLRSDEKGKVWGFWVGIEKRLPCDAHKNRYRQGNGNMFNSLDGAGTTSGYAPEEVRPRVSEVLVLDKSKSGSGVEHNFSNIAVRYRKAFRVNLSHGPMQKADYAKACSQYGEDIILEKFESWAPDQSWIKEKKHTNGLKQFYESLPDMIEADVAIQSEDTAKAESEAKHEASMALSQEQGRKAAEEARDKILADIAAEEKLAEKLTEFPF